MKESSIKRNFFFNILYQLFAILTPFITTPYISRVLGADGVGINSYVSSIMAYFTMFAVLGTTQYATREIAQLRDNQLALSKFFWEVELLSVLTTSICLLGWIVLMACCQNYLLYFAALTPTLIAVVFDISWLYIGLEKMTYIVIRNAICKILGIVFLFMLVKQKEDLFLYILLNSIIVLIGNLSMWMMIPKIVKRTSVKIKNVLNHLNKTKNYFVLTIAVSSYTILDKILIGLITGDEFQNGYYEQACKIINIAKMFSFTALNGIMGARLSYLFSKNQSDEIKLRIGQSYDLITLVGICFVFGIIAVAKRFVPIFFGPGYDPVVFLLIIMSPLIFIIGLSNCLGSHYYIPAGLIKKSTKYIIEGSIVNFCFNILLIPLYGAAGAVIGTLIGESLISILYCYNGRFYLPIKMIFGRIYKRVVAGIGMLCVYSVLDNHLEKNNLYTLLFLVFSCIFTYVIILKILRDSGLEMVLRQFLKKIKRKG